MMLTIRYPVKPHDIAIMGRPQKWQRSLVLHPLIPGQYSLVFFPKGLETQRYIKRVDLDFEAETSIRHVFTVPKHLRQFSIWQWRLVRWRDPINTRQPLSLEQNIPSLATIMFTAHITIEGVFRLNSDIGPAPHKVIVWSCNQPFDTGENGEVILNPLVPDIFTWYRQQVERFKPDIIWGLGDTAYSDGCDATNFVDAYYDHTQSLRISKGKSELLNAYRRMYRNHWSFPDLQKTMRNYPHFCMWDDHEIRDGWGSEANDFEKGNVIIREQASIAAQEYILNNGPRVRPPEKNRSEGGQRDSHQAYIDGDVAGFIFDGRSSRRYSDPGGKVISEEQLADFEQFCELLAKKKDIRFLIMGSAVPFINLKDFLENLISKAPKAITDLAAGIRDDVRDSWHSPGNLGQLKQLIGILRRLHRQHSTLEIINVSGDIHVANMFAFQPWGFTRALYQVTSSALSNRDHPDETLNEVIQVGTESWSEALGLISRIWPTVSDPNIVLLKPRGNNLEVQLKVYDLEAKDDMVGSLDSNKDLVYEVGKHRFSAQHLLL